MYLKNIIVLTHFVGFICILMTFVLCGLRVVLGRDDDWTRRNDFRHLGRWDFVCFMPTELLSIFVLLFLSSSYASLSYFNLTVPMRELVFGRTLMHELHIFYSHTEWNLFSSLCDNSENILKVECC